MLCSLGAGAGGSLLCVALSCLRGIICPFLALAPLVKCVCVFLLAGGGGELVAGREPEMPGM